MLSQSSDIIRKRGHAISALREGIHAVDPAHLVRRALHGFESKNIRVLSIGKAAVSMTMAAHDALNKNNVIDGIVVVPEGTDRGKLSPKMRVLRGEHPTPNMRSLSAARAVKEYVKTVTVDQTLVCLISGGGSSLVTLPPKDVSIGQVQFVTNALLRAGATIHEMNCVRKHLDRLKGGRLAKLCYPAPIYTLILSDVIGDPIDVIASGPTAPDPTTFAEAAEILQKYNVWEKASFSIKGYIERGMIGDVLESPKTLENVTNNIIGNNEIAAKATLACLKRCGYEGRIVTTELTGNARDVGAELAGFSSELKPGNCLVFAGETTVKVKGTGKGGRNQELALGAAIALHQLALRGRKTGVVASIGTDGIDGPTDAAGGIVDSGTVMRGRERTLNAKAYLINNDAYNFLKETGDLIITGPTGTNVMDLQVILT